MSLISGSKESFGLAGTRLGGVLGDEVPQSSLPWLWPPIPHGDRAPIAGLTQAHALVLDVLAVRDHACRLPAALVRAEARDVPLLTASMASTIAHGYQRLGALRLVVLLAAAVGALHLPLHLGLSETSGSPSALAAFVLALDANALHHGAYCIFELVLRLVHQVHGLAELAAVVEDRVDGLVDVRDEGRVLLVDTRRAPEEVLPDRFGQRVQEVLLPLHVVRRRPSGGLEVPEQVVILRDADGHVLELRDGRRVADLLPQGAEPDLSATFDVHDHSSPSVPAVELVRRLEEGARLVLQAGVEEAPDHVPKPLGIEFRHPALLKLHALDDLGRDLLVAEGLCPVQHGQNVRALGDPVAPRAHVPLVALVAAVEGVLRGQRDLVVEQPVQVHAGAGALAASEARWPKRRAHGLSVRRGSELWMISPLACRACPAARLDEGRCLSGPSTSTSSERPARGLHLLHQGPHRLLQGADPRVEHGDVEGVELVGGLVHLLLEDVDVLAVATVRAQLADEAVHGEAQPVDGHLHDLVVAAVARDDRGKALDVAREVAASFVRSAGCRGAVDRSERPNGVEVLLQLLELLLHDAEVAPDVSVEVDDDGLQLRLELLHLGLDFFGLGHGDLGPHHAVVDVAVHLVLEELELVDRLAVDLVLEELKLVERPVHLEVQLGELTVVLCELSLELHHLGVEVREEGHGVVAELTGGAVDCWRCRNPFIRRSGTERRSTFISALRRADAESHGPLGTCLGEGATTPTVRHAWVRRRQARIAVVACLVSAGAVDRD